jgi:hypothetical protein
MTERATRVVFLVHLIEAWDGCHDVFRSMESSSDFEPIVVSIPRQFPGAADLGFEEEIHRGLERENIPHLRLLPHEVPYARTLIKRLEPDVIIRQSQWDHIPAELGTDHLRFARTCLIPYETVNIVRNVRFAGSANSAVDSPNHRRAWVVFCANDLMLEMARRDAVRRGEQFRVVGHPKVDRLRCASPQWPIASENSSRRRRIAWSAHHSIGTNWTNFGAFPRMAADMLDWARRARDTEFVFLPHPVLIDFMNAPESPMTRADFDRWRVAWRALPNTGECVGGGYPSVLAASDLLITDGLSMLVEFQVFQRPLIFFERDDHRPFNAIGEIVRHGAHAVRSVDEARAKAEQLLCAREDPLAPRQREIVERLFGRTPSAPRVMSTLREMIAADRSVKRSRAWTRLRLTRD